MLRLDGLRKSFGPTLAVDGVSLAVNPGEVFGLLGPNGAGKSTTIHLAVGLLSPDAGRVEIRGLGPPTDPAARRVIGVAPQSLAVYDDLTGRENLAFFAGLFGLGRAERRRKADEALEAVGLLDRAADRAGTYSGGMKRRLNLAAGIVHDPSLIVLDEPTAGVDPQSRDNILGMVRRLAQRGRTVVYTTHYMEEAEKLCDRVAVIDRGRLLDLGTVHELIARHGGDTTVTITRGRGDHARSDAVPTKDPARTLREAMASGGDITAVRVDRPDLETVFLTLTGRSLRDA
ncbi:MAG: ABC transporter ATP-binding protein [Phycisphaeraceae bacterium]|nr:MAG: ABC transporter ATP-binding protein [Phycisphaeraceae bacterium]